MEELETKPNSELFAYSDFTFSSVTQGIELEEKVLNKITINIIAIKIKEASLIYSFIIFL